MNSYKDQNGMLQTTTVNGLEDVLHNNTMTCTNLLDDNDKLDAHSQVSIEDYNLDENEIDSNEKSAYATPNAPHVS